MKRKSLNAFYSFGLLLFISISAFAQETRKVAVFDPAGKVDEALLEIVREEISSVVVNTAGYTVLERQLINKVLEENKFQESGLVNDEQMSDIGKRMGADYVFVTAISMLGKNYYISCKMIEVATARIDKQSTGTTTKGIEDIPQTTQYIVRRLFGENVQQPVDNRKRLQQSVKNLVNQKDETSSRRLSKPAEDSYSLPVTSHETTIRKGFEIQGDVMYMVWSNFSNFYGFNISANYRLIPKLAFGINVGFFKREYDQNMHTYFFNSIYNFTSSKFSPYVALEMGIGGFRIARTDYYYDYDQGRYHEYFYYWTYDVFSIGIVCGLQYSFNNHFALKANLKGLYETNYESFIIGLGIGLIYHF